MQRGHQQSCTRELLSEFETLLRTPPPLTLLAAEQQKERTTTLEVPDRLRPRVYLRRQHPRDLDRRCVARPPGLRDAAVRYDFERL